MPDFRRRSRDSELMDQQGIAFDEFHRCLLGLETINRLTLAYRPTLGWLKARMARGDEACILDAGSGGGDMLRRIEKLAARRGWRLRLLGIDLNPWSKRSAELVPAPHSAIRYETADIRDFDPGCPVDLVVCSLFTHHLDDAQVVDFLLWMDRRARRGWFVNDLHRHPLPYYFILAATRLFSRNRLIRHDAAVSVARAFSAADWRRLLDQAGLRGRARLHWYFPFRLCVSCEKA